MNQSVGRAARPARTLLSMKESLVSWPTVTGLDLVLLIELEVLSHSGRIIETPLI